MLLFALKTLFSDRGKLLIALVGVVFSVVLINVQMGLFLGLVRKGSLLTDNVDADIWVGRRGVENIEYPYDIPEVWVQRLRGLHGVQAAEPMVLDVATMTLPNGEYEAVFVVGFERGSEIGGAWGVSKGNADDLDRPDSISIDELEAWKLGNPELGELVEISGSRARVAVMTRGVVSFTATPYVFTDLDSARKYGQMDDVSCSYILVKAVPGSDLDALVAQTRRLIPDADVYIGQQFSSKSRSFWISRTGIGVSFGGAAVLGVIVGFVMVAQSLYATTLDHIEDYATLKAIGAEDRHIYAVLILQATTIAVLGIAAGIATVLVIESFETPMAEIDLPPSLIISATTANFLICMVASLLPFQRISRVDPVSTLQG